MNISRIYQAIFAITLTVLMTDVSLAGRKAPPSDYYKIPSIFQPAPNPNGKTWTVQNFGPVGIGIDLVKPNFTMKIRNVEKGSPAEKAGKLKKGQIIENINGVVLKDKDPRHILGDLITEAEATDGKINLKIRGQGTVTVKIPIMGRYSKTWPLNCPKSDKIVRNLADLLAREGKGKWGSALFLLSTGEEKDLQVVRQWMSGLESIGSFPWHAGYNGIAVCEYYLRTGDKSVLPAIDKMAKVLRETMYNGGWSGRGHGSSFTYSTGTGQMHAAGVHCITFLMLAKMCGARVNEYVLQKSLKTFYRFGGHGNVPYGDGLPEGGFRDNGKSGGLAIAMAAAARLTPEGESSIYAKARDHIAMKSFYATNWFHSAHTGGGIGEIWHNAAMSIMHKKRPVQYRSFLDTRRWIMELSRRYDGSIGIAGVVDRYDRSVTEHQRAWGTYFALTYTLPRQKLQIAGAPRTQWCKSYKLPSRPWGTAADEVFLSVKPAKHPTITMADVLKEKVETDASLPVLKRINDPTVTDKTLLKYVHHPEFGLRCAAMRSIVGQKRYHLVLPLLKSDDPRIRHAGILAITGMFKGRAMPSANVTPEMYELVGNMVADPNESLWLVQDALVALSKANPKVIAKHRDRILSFLKNDDWIVRAAAIRALTPICTDAAHYQQVLPLMIKVLAKFTTDQAFNPARDFGRKLESANQTVKTFAVRHLREAYAGIPSVMTWPGGRIMGNGSQVVRSRIAALMKGMPGGMDFILSRPFETLKSTLSGNAADRYRYSGKFTPNKALTGTWGWALWPAPKNPQDVDRCIKAWLKSNKKNGYKLKGRPKDTLQLVDGGKVARSGYFKGYIWTGNMLISSDKGHALKMIHRNVDGVDFLLVEKGGFDKSDGSKGWHCGYHGYVRIGGPKRRKR